METKGTVIGLGTKKPTSELEELKTELEDVREQVQNIE